MQDQSYQKCQNLESWPKSPKLQSLQYQKLGLTLITPLEQFVQGFLDCLFGGHGCMCMSPLRNKNIHIKPLVNGFIIVDSVISIVPILVISPIIIVCGENIIKIEF
jgi:hypothetical protein